MSTDFLQSLIIRLSQLIRAPHAMDAHRQPAKPEAGVCPMTTTRRIVLALVVASLPLPVLAQDVQISPSKVTLGKREYSPYLDRGYPDRGFFGDTHLHTSYSTMRG
jgi:hypothetical protein